MGGTDESHLENGCDHSRQLLTGHIAKDRPEVGASRRMARVLSRMNWSTGSLQNLANAALEG
jgi:hypothetical protein